MLPGFFLDGFEVKERLQKLLARAGVASRRGAEELIRQGRVTVNGEVASLGSSADPDQDGVAVDGRPLRLKQEQVYLLLHKPSGYLTSLKDPQGRRLVSELVADVPQRVFPVGRLDLTTEGLLLMTNDGDLAYRLTHPKHEIPKTYLVRVRGRITSEQQRRLEQGVDLDDGPTAPAALSAVRPGNSHSWFEITIHEGRNRQVRRMCDAVGLPVSRLKRIRFAFLDLDQVAAGRYRRLRPEEVQRLKSL